MEQTSSRVKAPGTAGEPVLARPGTFPEPPNLLTLPKPPGTAKPVPELGIHFWAKNMDEDVDVFLGPKVQDRTSQEVHF